MQEPNTRLDDLVSKMREQGFRLTPQRLAVLKVLTQDEGHYSVEQIYEQVRSDFPMTSLATIYKTVALLEEMGEIVELGLSDGCNRYDATAHPHPHVICLRCKKIVDLELNVLKGVTQTVSQRTGYRIERQRLDFFGICPQCQEAA